MAKKELIILVGNIGTGKSTYSATYQKQGYIIISRDQIRYGIGNGKYIYNKLYEPTVFKIEKYMLKKFLELGINIIVDGVGVTPQIREKYILYGKKNGYKIIAIIMPRFSMEKAVSRRMLTPHGQYDRQLWENVWKKFDGIYEEPKKKEGFDKIIRLEEKDVA
jgi:predicted kinase